MCKLHKIYIIIMSAISAISAYVGLRSHYRGVCVYEQPKILADSWVVESHLVEIRKSVHLW